MAIAKNKRYERISSNIKILYHQTSLDAAKAIQQSGKMRRGSTGMANGGIYFAISKQDTDRKAKQRGTILTCRVKLGNVKSISASGDTTITFTNLINQGYDSVRIPRTNGEEFLVYNSDQVSVIDYGNTPSSLFHFNTPISGGTSKSDGGAIIFGGASRTSTNFGIRNTSASLFFNPNTPQLGGFNTPISGGTRKSEGGAIIFGGK